MMNLITIARDLDTSPWQLFKLTMRVLGVLLMAAMPLLRTRKAAVSNGKARFKVDCGRFRAQLVFQNTALAAPRTRRATPEPELPLEPPQVQAVG